MEQFFFFALQQKVFCDINLLYFILGSDFD